MADIVNFKPTFERGPFKEPTAIAADRKHLRIGCLRFDGLYDPSLPPSSSGNWQELTRKALEIRPTRYSPLHSDAARLVVEKWIRVERQRSPTHETWRIYYLPDDVSLASIPRVNKLLRRCLENILMNLDISPGTWNGEQAAPKVPFDLWATPDDQSLFYIFNTLKSPEPMPDVIKDPQCRSMVERLMNTKHQCRGLITCLYPYQRRAAAAMVQRESTPQLQLDPRLEPRKAVDGATYYYGPRDRTLLRHARHYDTITGGILAETMGLGKTVICIATILASLGTFPKVPPQHVQSDAPVRGAVASLMDMAATATTLRYRLPWKGYFQDIKEAKGEEMDRCINTLESSQPEYIVAPRIIRESSRRRSQSIYSKPVRVIMSSGTIIVVPRNLVHQWQSEIEKHVTEGALRVLVVDAPKIFLPSAQELATYDVILFSRPRFELENKQTETLYESPLKAVHWLRIIIDEGHDYSSISTHAVLAAEKLVKADCRWIVSGTPARDLLGVEVELNSMTHVADSTTHADYRQEILAQRRLYNKEHEAQSGAVKNLGALASRFLRTQPWASTDFSEHLESAATWEDHVYRHEDLRSRTYSSFSTCLRRTLQSLVIKTQPDDVERDLVLPPLAHDVVRLQPSLYDKLTANLFVLLFTANAITSERTDQDYLFHKNSSAHLHRLTANLRQSGFAWSGFDAASVEASMNVAKSYLEKEGTLCSDEDRNLMKCTMEIAGIALQLPGWRALSEAQELGVAPRAWPRDEEACWSFEGCVRPVLMGLTQVGQAQRYINSRLTMDDPLTGFDEAGVMSHIAAEEARIYAEGTKKSADADAGNIIKTGIPPSSVKVDSMGAKRISLSGTSLISPRRPKAKQSETPECESIRVDNLMSFSPKPSRKEVKKRRLSNTETHVSVLPTSPLGQAHIIGTTSAKLSYLMDRVAALYTSEKILIFYDAPHIAYYISQALDILHVKHLIYANTLSGEQRSKYIVLFDSDSSHRVLLMDLKQAAHGLNLSSASRVFFVNPALRPDIEAQAIKRAHRIGQTKPVHVETLLLAGTIEEAMHDRAAKMTQGEHLAAKTLEEDEGIRGIIQSARVLPILAHELEGDAQLAGLHVPQQIFGRPGRGDSNAKQSGLEEELFGDMRVNANKTRKAKKAKVASSANRIFGPSTSTLTSANELVMDGAADDSQSIFGTGG